MEYQILDTKSKTYLNKTYATLKACRKACDTLDNQYGACRFIPVNTKWSTAK